MDAKRKISLQNFFLFGDVFSEMLRLQDRNKEESESLVKY